MDGHGRTPVRRRARFLAFMSHIVCICAGCCVLLFATAAAAFTRGHGSLRKGIAHFPHEALQRDDFSDCQFMMSNSQDRRDCITSLIFGANVLVNVDHAAAEESNLLGKQTQTNLTPSPEPNTNYPPITITLPLEPASGGTLCVRVTVSASHEATKPKQSLWGRKHDDLEDSFRVYRAIVDTGSPYLVLPSSGTGANKQNFIPWTNTAFALTQKMEDSFQLPNSEYPPTEEIYGAVKGEINWKLARYAFRDPRLQLKLKDVNEDSGVVGVLDDALTNEATGGGMIEPYGLLGLIQNNNPNADRNRFPDPRPTFLEQECISTEGDDDVTNEMLRIKSFSINGPLREMTFSTQSLIPATSPAMPLVDLRYYGDFVDHYAVEAQSISFDGISVSSQKLEYFSRRSTKRPIVAVFDTGLTGCLLIRPFWDILQKYLGDNGGDVQDIKSVSLALNETEMRKRNGGAKTCNIASSLEDNRRFYVQPIDLDWFDDENYSPYVIVLGQAFLSQGSLTIDMDDRIATFN